MGTGSIQADEMQADDVNCTLLGTGYIGCEPVKSLNVKGVNGKVYYRGTPAKIKNHSLGVKLIPLDENSAPIEEK